MSTCPSTPPRKIRVETPEAPLHGITYDKEKYTERKEKEKLKLKLKEEAGHRGEGNQKEDTSSYPPTSSKSNSSASITFTISPPTSPISTSLQSPTKKLDVFRDNLFKSTTSDPSVGRSHMSSTKNTKFKPPPVHPNIKNPFTSQEYAQQTTGAQSLPTPAKTPSRKRKFTLQIDELGELDTTTRVLFPEQTQLKLKSSTSSAPVNTAADILDEASSARACTRKKPSNIGRDIGRDLFGNSEAFSPRSRRSTGSGTIEIYTDSNARVPEYDPSPENPFIDHPEGSTRDLSEKSLKKARKLREKIERSREEFENIRDGREDGMVYTFRGKKLFRKFEEDNSEVLGSGIQPRVLFPSARGARARGLGTVQEEDDQSEAVLSREADGAAHEFPEDDIDHFTAILDPHEALPVSPKDPGAITDIEQVKSTVKEEIEKVDKITHVVELDGQGNHGEETKTAFAVEEKSDDVGGQWKKPTRAPSAAPSVSSVASSNILSFGRRPRITKSVSNLSNGEGKAPALRRSKRLASTEPEPSTGIGKATIKQKLASKRGRTHDSALENTEKWAMEVQGGTRKRTKH